MKKFLKGFGSAALKIGIAVATAVISSKVVSKVSSGGKK